MPQRTISATGGNFGSVSTWVEGVVPTSSDFVLGDGTSGNLTLNTSYTVQYVDFTNYTGLLSMSSNALTLGLANATSSFGSSMSFTYSQTGYSVANLGNYGRFICNVAHNFTQNGTVRIPQLSFGAGTKTLATDIHVFRFRATTGTLTCNGNTLHIWELLSSTDEGGGLNNCAGTTLYRCRGTGTVGQFNALTIQVGVTGTVEVDGKYIALWGSPLIRNGGTFRTTATADASRLLVQFDNQETTNGETFNLDTASPLGSIRLFTYLGSAKRNVVINSLNNTLKCNYFFLLPFGQPWYISSAGTSIPEEVRFFGQGVEITNFINYPFIRGYNPSGGFQADSFAFMPMSPDIKFDSVGTYSITNLQIIGAPNTGILRSFTASSDSKLNTSTSSYIFSTSITDMDASYGSTLYLYGSGTISSSTNVEYGPPTGGGGQFGFATIT